MFIKNFIRRYMEQAGADSAPGGAGNSTTPTGETSNAPAGTAPADTSTESDQTNAQAPADGSKTDEGKTPDTKVTPPAGAPETYEFKLADGQTLNADVQSTFEATARELNMSQADAQKLVETMGPKIAATQAAAAAQLRADWAETAKADKEIGGQNFDANLAVAKTAMDKFATPEFKTFLNDTGLGNHPEMIRMLHRVGKSVSEDKIVPNNQGKPTQQRDHAKSLYPNSK